jgi:hypothetical protein
MLLAWLSLAYLVCLDLAIDPKSQILNSSKSRQIHSTSKNNTNSTINTHIDTHSSSSYILVDELVWPAGSRQLCLEQLPFMIRPRLYVCTYVYIYNRQF